MKASESIPNFPSKLREYTNFSVKEIKQICSEIGPRPSGSENELKAQKHIAGVLEKYADSVETEEFKVSTKAFMGWVIIVGILLLAAIALVNTGIYIGAIVCIVLAFILAIGEFVLYKKILDPFFKSTVSANVIAKREASGELKRRVIISGHVDSAFEWTFTHLGGAGLLKGVMIYGVLGLLYTSVIAVLGLIFKDAQWLTICGYVSIAFVPGAIAVLFFTNFGRPVEGANDNLTGSFTAVSCMKFLSDNNIRFENTEVVVLTTGSEEAGLRGAKDYAARHGDECKKIETVFLGFDTIRDYDWIAIYEKDLSGTLRHDARACKLLLDATVEAGLENIPYSSVYIGASDAAAITQAGIPASSLAAMDPTPARYYHTREDVVGILEPKTIEKGIWTALSAIFIFDERGLS